MACLHDMKNLLHKKEKRGAMSVSAENIYRKRQLIPEFSKRKSERQKQNRPARRPAGSGDRKKTILAVAAALEPWVPGERSCWEQSRERWARF